MSNDGDKAGQLFVNAQFRGYADSDCHILCQTVRVVKIRVKKLIY
jgi:hypothetical protein